MPSGRRRSSLKLEKELDPKFAQRLLGLLTRSYTNACQMVGVQPHPALRSLQQHGSSVILAGCGLSAKDVQPLFIAIAGTEFFRRLDIRENPIEDDIVPLFKDFVVESTGTLREVLLSGDRLTGAARGAIQQILNEAPPPPVPQPGRKAAAAATVEPWRVVIDGDPITSQSQRRKSAFTQNDVPILAMQEQHHPSTISSLIPERPKSPVPPLNLFKMEAVQRTEDPEQVIGSFLRSNQGSTNASAVSSQRPSAVHNEDLVLQLRQTLQHLSTNTEMLPEAPSVIAAPPEVAIPKSESSSTPGPRHMPPAEKSRSNRSTMPLKGDQNLKEKSIPEGRSQPSYTSPFKNILGPSVSTSQPPVSAGMDGQKVQGGAGPLPEGQTLGKGEVSQPSKRPAATSDSTSKPKQILQKTASPNPDAASSQSKPNTDPGSSMYSSALSPRSTKDKSRGHKSLSQHIQSVIAARSPKVRSGAATPRSPSGPASPRNAGRPAPGIGPASGSASPGSALPQKQQTLSTGTGDASGIAPSPKVKSGFASPVGSASPKIVSPHDTPRARKRQPKKDPQKLTGFMVSENKNSGMGSVGSQMGLDSVPEHHGEQAPAQLRQSGEHREQKNSKDSSKFSSSSSSSTTLQDRNEPSMRSISSSKSQDRNEPSTLQQHLDKLESTRNLASEGRDSKSSNANQKLQSKLEVESSIAGGSEQTIIAVKGHSAVPCEPGRSHGNLTQPGAFAQTNCWVTEPPSSDEVSGSPRLKDEALAFRYMSSLSIIDLSRQRIARLPESFQDLWDLRAATLAHNFLESFTLPGPWSATVQLLDISHNLLTNFPQLDHCKHLHTLLLAFNRLRTITCDTVVPTLVELQLGNNLLSNLGGLHNFPGLVRLDLRGNNLPKPSCLRSLSSFSSLRALALEGNPLASKEGCHRLVANFFPQVQFCDLPSGDRTARGYTKQGRRPAPLSLCTSEALMAEIEDKQSLFCLPEFLTQFSGGFETAPKPLAPERVDLDLTTHSIRPRAAHMIETARAAQKNKILQRLNKSRSVDAFQSSIDLSQSQSISPRRGEIGGTAYRRTDSYESALSQTLRPEDALSRSLLVDSSAQTEWLDASPLAEDVSGAPSPSRCKQHAPRRSPHSPSRAAVPAHPPCERVLRYEWKSVMPELSSKSLRSRQQDILDEMWQQAGGKWPTDDDPSLTSQTLAQPTVPLASHHDDNTACVSSMSKLHPNKVWIPKEVEETFIASLHVEDCVREPQYFPPQPAPVDGTWRTLELAKEKLMLIHQSQRYFEVQEGPEGEGEVDPHGNAEREGRSTSHDRFDHELLKKLRRRRRRREEKRRVEGEGET